MPWLSKKTNSTSFKTLNLNFGPQHPAAHGVLRMSLSLSNERVFSCDPHIGLLHRGTEHLITKKSPILSLPYFDRLDYVSMLSQEHAYCLSLENLLRTKPGLYIEKTRTLLDELTRILNHLLAIACHALDVGSMSPIFWSFEERENLMEVYENLCGARMHAAFYRPKNQGKQINFFFIKKIISSVCGLPTTLSEINSILVFSKVWRSRLKNVGVIDISTVRDFSLTGVLKRSSGLESDMRILKTSKYSFYKYIRVVSFISKNGDSYDRFAIRMCEMFECVNIIIKISFFSINKFFKKTITGLSIENTISKFKLWSDNPSFKKKEGFSYIESPKGSFGVYLVIDKKGFIKKCKIKSPSYNNLYLLKFLLPGHQLADVITLIGTIDIVFGEIDR